VYRCLEILGPNGHLGVPWPNSCSVGDKVQPDAGLSVAPEACQCSHVTAQVPRTIQWAFNCRKLIISSEPPQWTSDGSGRNTNTFLTLAGACGTHVEVQLHHITRHLWCNRGDSDSRDNLVCCSRVQLHLAGRAHGVQESSNNDVGSEAQWSERLGFKGEHRSQRANVSGNGREEHPDVHMTSAIEVEATQVTHLQGLRLLLRACNGSQVNHCLIEVSEVPPNITCHQRAGHSELFTTDCWARGA